MALSSLTNQPSPPQGQTFMSELVQGLKNYGLFVSLIAIMVFFRS